MDKKSLKNLSILITSLGGGGAERVVSILAEGLQLYYNVTLVLMDDTIIYDLPKNIKVTYLNKSNSKSSKFIKVLSLPYFGWKYSKLCKKLEIDFSLSFMYRPNFINVIGKFFNTKIKCVISERNTASLTYTDKNIEGIIGRFLIRWLYPKSDLIIPNSNGNSTDLIENFSINPDKIEVIHNPLNFEKIYEQSKKPVKGVNFKSKFTFISVGRLFPHKNHELTIRAYSKIATSNTQLLILGTGDLKRRLESLIKELGLENNTKLIGFTKNPYKYLSKSDCYILSSSREGFPNSLLEALSCGISVISSDCKSGPREILQDGKLGDLYDVGDQIGLEKLLLKRIKNIEEKKSTRERNMERLKEFELNRIVRRYNKVLRQI